MSATRFVSREFVYTGERIDTSGKRYVTLRLIEADGTLSTQMAWGYKRELAHSTGSVYSCEFSEDGSIVRGLSGAKWLRQWPTETDRIEWTALTEDADADLKRIKMEADAGRISDIEKIMLPLRTTHAAMRNRFDNAGCRALEAAVMSALRAPPRKTEQK